MRRKDYALAAEIFEKQVSLFGDAEEDPVRIAASENHKLAKEKMAKDLSSRLSTY